MNIVEGDEHGLLTRQLSKDAEKTSRDSARLWIGFRLGEEERALERTSLRTRQAGNTSAAHGSRRSERRMRQLRLGRHRLRR